MFSVEISVDKVKSLRKVIIASDHLCVLLFLEKTCYIQENVWCFGVAGRFLPCKRERVGYEENNNRTVYSECQPVALIE